MKFVGRADFQTANKNDMMLSEKLFWLQITEMGQTNKKVLSKQFAYSL